MRAARVVIVENVQGFTRWERFPELLGALASRGYHVDVREICASTLGAATRRRRAFIVARRDAPPAWPSPVPPSPVGPLLRDLPLRPLSEISSPAILARVAEGEGRFARAPFLAVRGYGERPGQTPRVHGLSDPIPTIVASGVKLLLVVPGEGWRALAWEELAAAQGFPEGFIFPEGRELHAIGSSVVPAVAEALIRENDR